MEVAWYLVAIVVAAGILMFVVTWPQHLGARRRRQSIAVLAASLGYSYSESADDFVAQGPGGLSTFNLGTKREARNLVRIRGDEGALFDHISTRSYGRRAAWWKKTAYAAPVRTGTFPQMQMRPAAFGDALVLKLAGHDDVDFAHDEEFSKHYVLRGADEAQLRPWFTDTVREFFARQQDWHAESDGRWLAVWRGDTLMSVAKLESYLTECREAVSHLLG